MSEHYDKLETRSASERDTDLFARLSDVLGAAAKAPAYAERLKGVDLATITSRAALATLPVLRKSELPASHKTNPPFGGFVHSPVGSFGRLRNRGSVARGTRIVCRWLSCRRHRAQHIQLSSHAGRIYFRYVRPRTRLCGHSRRPRQYRTAIRTDRGLSPNRLFRDARFPQNPARCGFNRRTRYLVDHARNGIGCGVSKIAAD